MNLVVVHTFFTQNQTCRGTHTIFYTHQNQAYLISSILLLFLLTFFFLEYYNSRLEHTSSNKNYTHPMAVHFFLVIGSKKKIKNQSPINFVCVLKSKLFCVLNSSFHEGNSFFGALICILQRLLKIIIN